MLLLNTNKWVKPQFHLHLSVLLHLCSITVTILHVQPPVYMHKSATVINYQ